MSRSPRGTRGTRVGPPAYHLQTKPPTTTTSPLSLPTSPPFLPVVNGQSQSIHHWHSGNVFKVCQKGVSTAQINRQTNHSLWLLFKNNDGSHGTDKFETRRVAGESSSHSAS